MDSVELGQVATLYDSLHKTPKSYQGSGVPMVRVTDVARGYLSLEGTRKVSKAVYEEFSKKYKPQLGDTIFTRVGSYGNSAYVDKDREFCLGQNTVCISPKSQIIEPYYLFSFLHSPQAKHQIDSFVGGSSQPTISLASIKSLKIELPDKEHQLRIVEILRNYEELLANNNRRIAILEEMAQSLYREWFVKFHYPGHENQTLIDSPLGPIPEGWEVKALQDIADVNPESITKKSAPDEIGYIDIKSVEPGLIKDVKTMLFSDAPSRARRLVRHGDIIWATVRPNRRQYSYICNPKKNTIASTGFAVIRSKTVPASYIYSLTTTQQFTDHLVNHATGSAYPAVNAAVFQETRVLVPPTDLLEEFDKVASNALRLRSSLDRKNHNAKKQRDMLLPKLISGQIELKD